MDDEIIVQEFGLYQPHYDFASALDYKEELAKIRAKQKELIKNKNAVSGSTEWTVNGSVSKGKKMVSDTQKLLMRAFNSECDDLISRVKYTNFDATLDRIYKSAEAISKLGTIMSISITQPYLTFIPLRKQVNPKYNTMHPSGTQKKNAVSSVRCGAPKNKPMI